jgi:RHS repeat-associated protein
MLRASLLSTAVTSNGSGVNTGSHYYTAYGRYRGGSELGTENRFTSQKLDATGLYFYNARYYDPRVPSGRGTFISPDTLVPDPTELLDYNRYLYARGDPLKYNDPSGHNPNTPCCMTGPYLLPQVLQLVADFAGVLMKPAGEIAQIAADQPMFGPSLGELEEMRSHLVGTYVEPYLPEGVVSTIHAVNTVLNTPGVSDALLATIRVPSVLDEAAWILPKSGGGARIRGRWYTEHALERMAPNTPEVMAELEIRALRRAEAAGLRPGTPEFKAWWSKHGPNPRGIPPSVVEAEIANPGTTGITVITNEQGGVITVIPRSK